MTIQSYHHNISVPQDGITIIDMPMDILLVEVISELGDKRAVQAGYRSLAVVTKRTDVTIVVYYEGTGQVFPGKIKQKNLTINEVGKITYDRFISHKKRLRIRTDTSGSTPSIVYARVYFKTFMRGGSIIEGGIGYTTIYGREISKDDTIESLIEFSPSQFKTATFYESGEIVFSDDVAYAECSIEMIIMSKSTNSTPVFRNILILGEDV